MQKYLIARLCNFYVCMCLYVWFYMVVKWFSSNREHILINVCQPAMHIHTRSFHRIFFGPKHFEDLWGILRLPSPFCGIANHCTLLLHQSENSLLSHPFLIFPRPMQNCLFQHKSAPVQAVILTFWEFTRVGTVCIRLLEINPRVPDPHSTTGLF